MIDTKMPDGRQVVTLARFGAVVVVVWAVVVLVAGLDLVPSVIALAALVVPPAFTVGRLDEAAAADWAGRRGVRFPAEVVPQLHRHLVRTRLARTVGFFLGWAVDLLLMAGVGPSGEHSWYSTVWKREWYGGWCWGAGFVLASVVVELTKPRSVTGERGSVAVLAPSRLVDFIDARLRRPLWWSLAGVPVVLVVWAVEPGRGSGGQPVKTGSAWATLAVAVVSFVAAVAICRRRERAGDEVAVAYEELTRSATLNALVGATVGMAGAFATEILISNVVERWVPTWVSFPLFLLVALGAMSVWATSGSSFVFRSRRMDALRDRATKSAA